MSEERRLATQDPDEDSPEFSLLDDAQKRRLRAVRRGYRADEVQVRNNGWELEVSFLDGSKIVVSSKLLKLKAQELAPAASSN